MKLIYIHQYFVTPSQGGGTRSYYLAKGLIKAGIEVDLITTHSENSYDFKMVDGIKVHYLPVSYRHEFGFVKRIWAFMKFVNLAKKLLTKLPKPDLLYITSTPLTTGWIGLWAKRKLGIPFIFEVRDLWPDAPVQVGAIKNPLLKKYLYQLESRIYAQAEKIVALSPGIATSVRDKCPKAVIHLIPNFADTDFFTPMEKSAYILNSFGLEAKFTVAYIGAIGKVNAVEEVIELAKMAQERTRDYQFVIMGKGSMLDEVLQKVKSIELKNLHYFPFGNKEEVRQLLAITDLAMVTFAHLPILATNSPNKFFDAIASGKGIIINHQGWVQKLVSDHHLGIYFDKSNPEVGFGKLEELASNPKLLGEYQANARALAEKFFSHKIAVNHLLSVLEPDKFQLESNQGFDFEEVKQQKIEPHA